MQYEPIAIIGEGCVLPGASSPGEFWQAILSGQRLYSAVPASELGLAAEPSGRGSYASGRVRGFRPPRDVMTYVSEAGLPPDPLYTWTLSAARQALAGTTLDTTAPQRRGVFVANLFYPSAAKVALAETVWRGGRAEAPGAYDNSGGPARLLAGMIGAKGAALALDAACASSLYALDLACRKLIARDLDLALVVAVNATDNLILHIGFDALKALSPTGRSQPFCREADGLVPSEGAVAVVLKRLADVTPDERVHAIIRGIGLSNDGRRKGLLAPDADGQTEAMARAYAAAGLDPSTVGYLECHATGTPAGDAVEIAASAAVFREVGELATGSLKANTGHLITAAGLASLLKMSAALRHGIKPPSALNGTLSPAFAGTRLRPLAAAEPWECNGAARRAAISNFGFGGNNAHLVLDEPDPVARIRVSGKGWRPPQADDIAICGIGLLAGGDRGLRAVLRRLMNRPIDASRRCTAILLDAAKARVPPTDLDRAEAQQLAILSVAQEALAGIALPAPERCGIFAASPGSADSARWAIRARLEARISPEALSSVASPLLAADVLGAMANISANRLTAAYDVRGQGFALAAGRDSSPAALDAAVSALHDGLIDLAVVCAADFSTDCVASAALDGEYPAADLAAALVLRRRRDADAWIYGRLTGIDWGAQPEIDQCCRPSLVYGEAPAAAPLFDIAAVCALSVRGQVFRGGVAAPDLRAEAKPVLIRGQDAGIRVEPGSPRPSPDPLRATPALFYFAGSSRTDLATAIRTNRQGKEGQHRLAVLAACKHSAAIHLEQAASMLDDDRQPAGDGVFFGEGHPEGELAFCFTGSAAGYPRMGRGLLAAFPQVAAELGRIEGAAALSPLLTEARLTEYQQLCAVSLVTQAHAILLRDVLKLTPDAAIGLSLGESNALFAFGAWSDMAGLLAEIEAAAMYERHLGGAFETASQAWGPNVPKDWTNWRISAPLSRVRSVLADFPNVEITIIYSDTDCMIGGPAADCRTVAARLPPGRAVLMNQHLIVHARAMTPFAETWRRLHTRKTKRVSHIRFYTNAINGAYVPTRKSAADMLTAQAVATVDFPQTIRQAWEDGVRTFIEVGPRDTLSQSITATLGARPHLAVACDRVDTAPLAQIAEVAARLFAEGRAVDIEAVARQLDEARLNPWPAAPEAPHSFTAHRAAPVLPPVHIAARYDFPRAPPLPRPARLVDPPPERPAGPVPFIYLEKSGARIDGLQPPKAILSGREPLPVRTPTGRRWSRPAIEASARGAMSEFFGPQFACQDVFRRQVRLPAPPLLLIDRITGLDAPAGVEGPGVIWTETDLKDGDWFLHNGIVRPGPLIECGQADLTLIGWMGADFRNADARVYRLLGCEITFHAGGLPKVGETLRFQIEITQHATFSGVRMFFFQYDCFADGRPAFSVRQGQAGFFTDAELASAKGLGWDPGTELPPTPEPPARPSLSPSRRRSFSSADIAAFRRGDAFACFGPGFEICAAHSAPPHLPGGALALFDEVPVFDPEGGPWKRGYLKARARVSTDAWFFDGHFHNDPCMPGTLMAEAAVQALEFYAAAMGLTIERDGYRFEPVPGHTAKFVCRGQVIPDSDHDVTYEVFVDTIEDGEMPVVRAALLASCDGRKVFYCPCFAIQLRRFWNPPRAGAIKLIGPGRMSRGDEAALLDCANGPPSSAFGEMYRQFDTAGRIPRLPQPPYHMITRIVDVTVAPGTQQTGAKAIAEYDIDEAAWFFADNRNPMMPVSVLVEILLQPCGWLASHCGFALNSGERFRNLDGDGRLLRAIPPGTDRLVVTAELTSFTRFGTMTLVGFSVDARDRRGQPVMSLATRFGFFPVAALAKQAGLPVTPHDRALIEQPGIHDVPVTDRLLPAGRLAMIDRVDFWDPKGGSAGLGLARGRQAVDPYAWYFKAHFFNDPVQPGSLGLDALTQLLIRAALLRRQADGAEVFAIETLAVSAPIKWSFRGQVTPDRKEVTTIMEITAVEDEAGAQRFTGRGSLWCDGLRIYEASPLVIRLLTG